MRIINDDLYPVSIGWMAIRPSSKKYAASFIIKGTFQLYSDQCAAPVEGDPDLVSGDIYYDDDDARSLFYSSDFVPFKPRTDLLLNATAHTPDGKPVNNLNVGFGVGKYLKQFTVFGKRQWIQGLTGKYPGEPQSFTEMLISYENAFGGENYKSNPIGKGRESSEMPNIEFLKHRLGKPDENLPPASFGALNATWAQRKALVGTYRKNYAEERWPCFSEDFDWSFFNSAPKDQQVKGYVRGDESIFFQNLHLDHPEYRSVLPSLRARCFLEEVDKDYQPGNLREVSLNLDTVWVDMETEKLVLVWRGLTEVQSPRLKEFSSVFVLTEPLSEPAHDLNYYQALMQETLTKEGAEFKIEELPSEDVDEIINKEMAALDADVAQAEKEFADLESSSVAEEAKHLQLVKERMGDNKPLLENVLKQPPMNNIPLNDLMPYIEALRAERPDLADQWLESLKEAEHAEKEMAEMDAAEAEFDASMVQEPTLTRDTVITKINFGKGLENADLSGLDLSKLDLSGVNLAGARLKQVDLSETNLSSANLKAADLSESSLSGANLGDAVLDGARLRGAECTGTIFRAVSIEGTDFSDLVLKDADFTNASGKYTDFSGADLTGAVFVGAKLPHGDFDGSQLNGADFRKAEIKDADFSNVQAQRINFDAADISGLRSGEDSDFSHANMRFTKAAGSMWETCVLDNADLSHTLFTGAQFVDASLVEAKLDRVIADGANFEDANLQRAWLVNSNFLRSSFERANLSKVNLQGSNLYESGFLDVVLSETNFRSANLKGTMLG